VTDASCGDAKSGKVCVMNQCQDGCRGLNGNGCSDNLVCNSTDSTVGQCVECTSDANCGDESSGKVCAANQCVDGCRGVGGNQCGVGFICTSETETAGQCIDETTGVFASGGWACAVRPTGDGSTGGSLGLVAAALGAVGAGIRRRRRRAAAVASVLASAVSLDAAAQESTGQVSSALASQEGLAVSRYQTSWAGDTFLAVTSPHVTGKKVAAHARLMTEFVHRPIVLLKTERDGSTSRLGDVVTNQFFVHANASLALFDRFGVNVDVPFATFQNGDDPTIGSTTFTSPSGGAVGDPRVGVRGRLLGENDGPFQLGVGGYVWIPVGTNEAGSFVSNGKLRGLPMLTLGGTVSRFLWSVDAGAELRDRQVFAGTVVGNGVRWAAGAGYVLGEDRNWQLGGEAYGGLLLADAAPRDVSVEALGSVRWRFAHDFVTSLAAGSGVTQGLGTPQARGLLSVEYSPLPRKEVPDRDGDGIDNAQDACPDTVGVGSTEPSRHGCPQPKDSDGDGVIDGIDACPNEAGPAAIDPARTGCPATVAAPDQDRDGLPDASDFCPEAPGIASADPQKNGCPDADRDGIVDAADVCPNQMGVAQDDNPERNGCPIVTDNDGDGILNTVDACPDVAGVASRDAQKNGCPDADGDGVVDAADVCPNERGVAQEDNPERNGCPVAAGDEDKDGIAGAADACPKDPGEVNSDPKKNGCPKVRVTAKEVVFTDIIEFDPGRSRIQSVSNPVIDAIAKVLVEHTELLLIEVQGHTDNQGAKADNQKLSNERAAAIAAAMVKRGVAKDRLVSKGYGQDEPVVPNTTDANRKQNRRIQFIILKKQ
ncbi:MAG: OmpA family protein, partial [Deltaproteobacteria bacterium]|nr:OmpA family protein [Deltaproteobacteria bacterium]